MGKRKGYQSLCRKAFRQGSWSPDWRDLFVDASIMNLHATTSDHNAIYLCLKGRLVRRVGRRFKFEAAWIFSNVSTHVGKTFGIGVGIIFESSIVKFKVCVTV